MKIGLSIVICTYNGASRLSKTLCHIAHQKVPTGIEWEVVLIDNASTDGSARIAEELWSKYACKTPLHIVQQPMQGLNFARDMGFSKAQYEYILMCDDDNWLGDDYVLNAYNIMQRHPTIGILGGHGNLVYETNPPDWVTSFPIHAGGAQAPSSGIVRSLYIRNSYGVYGAGSILRKSAYDTICLAGFQFLLTDRIGTRLSSGGDMELCYAIALAGYWI